MKLFSSIFLLAFFLFHISTFSQSKQELLVQVEKQTKSIDSLKLVIENFENVVENRDRSIRFLNEDIIKLQKEKDELSKIIKQKNSELVLLRNQNKSGVAGKLTMNNTRSTWTVPAGKHWVINQFIADYITDLQKDSLGNMVGKEIHIFLKSINTVTLTDAANNIYGPQVFCSSNPNHTIQFPLILTENTSFSIVVFKGNYGAFELYDGNVICTYYEKEN